MNCKNVFNFLRNQFFPRFYETWYFTSNETWLISFVLIIIIIIVSHNIDLIENIYPMLKNEHQQTEILVQNWILTDATWNDLHMIHSLWSYIVYANKISSKQNEFVLKSIKYASNSILLTIYLNYW